MRNIAEIIKDDRNGKQLSRTERQIAVAYTQGKYDAVRELKISSNSNTNEVLGKIRAEIIQVVAEESAEDSRWALGLKYSIKIIDKYRAGSEVKE